ncbi:sodium:solute symporter [Asticcacaulis endophyticus]|uniref:Sodium/glucose cotransporter 2 n=1 Tax=Asticcacaulis endophyticus TaxID=1395890 RepID=A0A918PXK6_9CAUL|nr:sodium:solute symporter [Asticcacaulis endophyticus]GGZ26757.1 sodium/glucose cotransporter 2 [Asticcacaulis endophyticus]
MAGFQLSWVDSVIIAAYLIGLVTLALMARTGALNPDKARDHFLAGRSAPWYMIGFALFASNMTAVGMIGLPGSAYAHGINVHNYEWMGTLVLPLFCAFVLPTYLSSNVFTVPEFLERRYSRFARTYLSGLTIFLCVLADTAGALFAGGVLLQILLPGAALWQISCVLALCAGIFLIIGGLRAVMVTEAIQAVILLIGGVIVAVLTVNAAGGWEAIKNGVPASHLSLIRPDNDPVMPWTGLVTGGLIIGFYFWCTNQFMVQRMLAARSLDHGRWGGLFAGLLKLSSLFLLCIPGVAAVLIFPSLARPDQVFPSLILTLLPTGILGILIAAFLATIISTLAANYNAASTLVTIDFVRRFKPDMSDAALIRAGRITVVILMLLSMLWVPMIGAMRDSLWQYLQAILSYFVPPVAAVFFAGLFWRRANDAGAKAGLIIGTLLSVVFFISVEITHAVNLHFLKAAFVIFAVSLIATAIASLMTAPPEAERVNPLTFSGDLWQRETLALKSLPWWQNYRILSVALIVVTALMVWMFR